MKRLSMRKIRDALRLSAEGLSTRRIAASLAIGRTTIQGYLDRARDAELSWPLPPEMSDTDLERLIYPRTARDVSNRVSQPDWPHIHHELRRKELLSSLVFEALGSCSDLVVLCGFNSVFEFDARDDFGQRVKAA